MYRVILRVARSRFLFIISLVPQIRVPETHLIFHRLAQRTVFRSRDVHQQSRLFPRCLRLP